MSYKFNHADEEQHGYRVMETNLASKTKIGDIATVSVLVALLFGFCIAFFVLPDKSFSENENRALQKAPEASFDNIISGKYTSDFAAYFTDQFPLRDQFIAVKAACELAIGKNENNGVLYAKGGYLIERMDDAAEYSAYRDAYEGKDDFIPSYSSAIKRTESTLKTNVAAISAFRNAAEKSGVDTIFAVAGRLSDIAGDTAALYPAEADDEVWSMLGEHTDLLTPLKTRFDDGEYVYYRTDHHWTTLGAYYAYREIMQSFGAEPHDISHYNRESVADDFYGTTWSSSGIRLVAPDKIEYFHIPGDEDGTYTVSLGLGTELRGTLYDRSYLEKKDKYSSFISDNRARTDITKSGEEREKMLVIKDSFAMSLVPFLAEDYDIVMLDMRYYKLGTAMSIIENENISKVLILYNMDSLTSDPTIAMVAAGVQ